MRDGPLLPLDDSVTAPVADAVTTAPAVDLNDDALVAAALGARLERGQHAFPDEPAPPGATDPTPSDAPAPDPATVAAPKEADSTPPDPATEVPADPETPDPFAVLAKDAKPLGYRVNATDRVFDAILEVPGKGAIIPADKLGDVRNMVARYESNAQAVKDLMPKVQQFEGLTHTVTGQNGQPETLRGMAAHQRLAEEHAALNQVGGLIMPYLTNPERLLSLLALDANNNVVPNLAAIEMLRKEAFLLDQRTRFETQRSWGERAQQVQQTEQTETVRAQAIPGYLSQAHADLHADDRAFLEQNAPQYLFTVTAETAHQYGQPIGTVMIDLDTIGKHITHLKTVRGAGAATQAATTAAVAAAQKAAAENARRNVPPPATKKAPVLPRDKETGQWKRPDRMSMDEIMDRSLEGKPIGRAVLTE